MKKLLILSIILMLLAASLLLYMNRYTMGEQVFTFASTYGSRSVTLQATLWQQENAEYAALICPGYSCDRQKWRPFANMLRANGITVMTFDYAGQGASSGTIGFDNAKTDAIPVEIDDAIA